jgi:two-component sensor histidine kinase
MEIWGLAPLAEIAELVLSELLSNSVRHARNPRGRHIETRYEKTNAAELRIEVHDANTSLPIPQKADTDAEAGRGLVLVHALTQGRWGVEERPHGIGKLVWAVCADTGAVGVSG